MEGRFGPPLRSIAHQSRINCPLGCASVAHFGSTTASTFPKAADDEPKASDIRLAASPFYGDDCGAAAFGSTDAGAFFRVRRSSKRCITT
jgi:hypothetical protein